MVERKGLGSQNYGKKKKTMEMDSKDIEDSTEHDGDFSLAIDGSGSTTTSSRTTRTRTKDTTRLEWISKPIQDTSPDPVSDPIFVSAKVPQRQIIQAGRTVTVVTNTTTTTVVTQSAGRTIAIEMR